MNLNLGQISEIARELASIRHISLEAGKSGPEKRVQLYTRREVFLFPGVKLDDARPVAAFWSRTAYSDSTCIAFDSTQPKDRQYDAGDGFGIASDFGGPFLLRAIKGSRIGEIFQCDSITYELARREARQYPNSHTYEPVPSGTECRPPLMPAGMPTDLQKCRRIVGKATKKDADTITFEETKAWFEKRHGNGTTIVKV